MNVTQISKKEKPNTIGKKKEKINQRSVLSEFTFHPIRTHYTKLRVILTLELVEERAYHKTGYGATKERMKQKKE